MVALAFLAIGGGLVILIAGMSGSSIASVAKGHPDHAKAVEITPSGEGSETGTPGALHAPASAKGIVAPLPKGGGVKHGRTDQGVDFSAPAGTPLFAMGDAVVSRIDRNFYAGQPAIYLRYLTGPLAGKETYYSEQVSPQVHEGQRVRAGQQVAQVASSGTGLELGWGSSGIPAAKSEGYAEGQETGFGKSFDSLLGQLGL